MARLALPLGAALLLAGCARPTPLPPAPTGPRAEAPPAQTEEARGPVSRTRRLGVMGTDLAITAWHEDPELLERALDAAVLEIQRVEDLMTDWRDSPLTDLNRAAGDGPHKVPRELAEMIERGLLVGELTGGAFDLTFRTFGRLWDFKARPPRLPEHEEIVAALARCGWEKVSVDLEASTVTRPEGLEIGLGGIAKGYGVDRAMAVLMEAGIRDAIVNAGGDLKALGRNGDELWTIAIKHPRDRERVLAVLPVSNTCVVTSGDYERFFEHEGRRYHHILDPRTGYPAEGCTSATVVAPDAAVADALATAICVMGPEAGLAVIESLERVEALAVDLEGRVHATSGLSSRLEAPASAEGPGK
jgi:thiamine biosynthesis lipoprotein